jgi:hypothetical protein
VSVSAETLERLALLRDQLPEPAAAPAPTTRRRKRSSDGETVLRRGVEGFSAGTPVSVIEGLADGAVLVQPLAAPDEQLTVSVWDLQARRRSSSPPRPPVEEAPSEAVSVGNGSVSPESPGLPILIFASRAATDQYRRLGGTGILENAILDAILSNRTRKSGGRRSVWLGGLDVELVKVESPMGRKAWRATRVRRRGRS